MKSLVAALALFMLLPACSIFESDDHGETQEYLFEVQYINAAWGFIHVGLFIDYHGEVKAFRFDSAATFLDHEKDEYNKKELEERYAFGRKFLGSVGPDSLNSYKKLIPFAVSADYGDTLRVGADMGQKMYSCFTYDNGIYKKVLLKTEGDWVYSLESAESDSLVKWLDGIWNRYANTLLSD